MKEIEATAGQRVAVIRRAFSSVPMEYRFQARAAKPGQAVSGTVEVRKSRWILPGVPTTQPLQATNVVSAGFWNTFVSVDVVPAVESVITIDSKSLRHGTAILLMAVVIVIAACALIAMFGR